MAGKNHADVAAWLAEARFGGSFGLSLSPLEGVLT